MPIDTALSQLPAEFVGSFPDHDHPLVPTLPELVFVGRSNVGKSSLINAVAGRKLAKTSGTPGKTQQLVVFRFPTFYLLDLPGYGYAKVSYAERRRIRALIERTIEDRATLTAVVWLIDIRHPPSADDLAIRAMLGRTGRPAIVALTKADKLSRVNQIKARDQRISELEVAPDHVILTSSSSGLGIAELGESIIEVVSEQ